MASEQTIGEMSEREAKLVLLHAVHQAFGVVPEHARRRPDGGYTLMLHCRPDALGTLRCRALVTRRYGVEEVCGRGARDNLHRTDAECADPKAHRRYLPFTLHHPFVAEWSPDA